MFKNFLKSQLIEVIEWTDSSSDTMVYQFPVQNKEIKMGAQLTVRESQAAVFINEGQIADVFSPGRYQLDTQNLPVLTKLKSWKYGFNSPFKSEVYFVNTKQFTHQKWGTSNPVMMRDQDFGMLRFRAFGTYSFRVVDPIKFLREIFGTNNIFTTHNIADQLKRMVTSGVSDMIAESQIPALDLSMYYDQFGEQSQTKLKPKFEAYGFDVTSVVVENISLPPEVEAQLDQRTSMGIIGDMGKYTQYKAAEALGDAARNEGSGAVGAGMGLGAGAAFGGMIANAMSQPQQQQQPQHQQPHYQQPQHSQPPQPTAAAVNCHNCNSQLTPGAKFCGNCGNPTTPPTPKCTTCNKEFNPGMKFCPECGSKLM